MAKYITAFETINDYNDSKGGLDYPNISLIKSDSQIEWVTEAPTPAYQGFCKLTLNDDSVVELEGSGELTDTMTSSYQSTLVSAEIGTLCTSIGNQAFQSFYDLTSVSISNSVTSIGASAFKSCSKLKSIDIPSSVTSIGASAFRSCSSLTSVTVNATTPPTLRSYAFINTNNCPIYVPSGSVETYKSASGWNSYQGRITANNS